MIELTRLRLIHWHNFQDETISFRNATYLIGVNAVGKTTIMDAIRYCLTTNKEFNTAGNQRSKRTLQGSVHGKQRGENLYLRPGRTVAYVGVEFFDHKENAPFVIVVRVESDSPTQELKQVAQDWFLTRHGIRLEDLQFLDADRRPTTKEVFKNSCDGIRNPATQRDARNYICRSLGIGDAESSLGKKFNEVFHMGTSLKEIQDIRSFIYAYILPEPEIKVEDLQSDMRELERLEETLLEAKTREKLLGEVVEQGNRTQELQNQVWIYDGMLIRLRLEQEQRKGKQCQQELIQAKQELSNLVPERQRLEERKKQTQEALRQAERERDDDPQVQAAVFYQQEQAQCQQELDRQQKRYENWNRSMTELEQLLGQLDTLNLDDTPTIQKEHLLEQNQEQQLSALVEVEEKLHRLEEVLDEESYQLRRKREQLQEERKNHVQELNELKKGKMVFPPPAELLRRKINGELEKQGLEQDAKILCELLYMEDEEWQDCAEAALGRRRFDVLVSPKHYPMAKQVFAQLGEQVEDIALVNTVVLEQDSKQWEPPQKEMLAAKVGSENRYAKQYINYLLHDIICCEQIEQLEQYRNSVSRDLLRHQGYRLQRMKQPIRCIGSDARRERQEQLQELIAEQMEQLKVLEEQGTKYGLCAQTLSQFIYGRHLVTLKQNLDVFHQLKQAQIKLSQVAEKIRDYETNPLLAGLFDRVKNCQEACEEVDSALDELKKQIWVYEKGMENTQKNIERNLQELDVIYGEKQRFEQIHPELIEAVIQQYGKLLQDCKPEERERTCGRVRSETAGLLQEALYQKLQPKQQEYNQNYVMDYPLGLNGLEEYRKAYNELVHIELERSIENLQEAKLRCKERFRKEILFRMKDDIQNAKLQFRALDRVMTQLTYGEERYHFSLSEPQDTQLRNFYHMILDEANVQITESDSFFTREAMSQPAYEAQVDELMERIMADINQAAQERATGEKPVSEQLSRYVDYRTYLEYDIQVENVVTGLKVPLSQVSGDSSGGENQAPFYVAICASLLQIYRHSPNSIRLVLLDEAFNNMTSDRIEPMMQMFHKLGLQLVLISTVEKCSSIYPYCDVTYSIVKAGSRAVLAPFEKIEL